MHKSTSKEDYQWIDKWSSLVSDKRVLELGCGSGIDTHAIAGMASTVVACGINPGGGLPAMAQVLELDYREPMPFAKEFDVVVASLSLHYFDWATTEKIVTEISRVLVSGSFLLYRLNSDKDINYGASGFSELEPGLMDVEGTPKRFFDKASIHQLFSAHWYLTELEHKAIDRYEKPKYVWEFGAVNA